MKDLCLALYLQFAKIKNMYQEWVWSMDEKLDLKSYPSHSHVYKWTVSDQRIEQIHESPIIWSSNLKAIHTKTHFPSCLSNCSKFKIRSLQGLPWAGPSWPSQLHLPLGSWFSEVNLPNSHILACIFDLMKPFSPFQLPCCWVGLDLHHFLTELL